MVGGTSFHRWIHEASLGRNAGKRKDSFREEGKKRAPAARTVYVSLDRADAIIDVHVLQACAQAVDFKVGAHFGEGQGENSDWRDFNDLQGSKRKNLD